MVYFFNTKRVCALFYATTNFVKMMKTAVIAKIADLQFKSFALKTKYVRVNGRMAVLKLKSIHPLILSLKKQLKSS